MELKHIKIIGSMIPNLLKLIIDKRLSGDEFDFAYGQEEYTKDYKKVKQQFKTQLKKTFRYGNG